MCVYRWCTPTHAPSLFPAETHHPNRAYIFRWYFSLMFFVDVFKYSTPAHTHVHTHVFSLSHTHTHPLAQPSPLLPVSLITRHTHTHTTHTFSLSHTHTLSQPSPLLPFSLAGLLWCYALCQRRFATYQKRPTYIKGDLHLWKETWIQERRPAFGKRDMCVWKHMKTELLCIYGATMCCSGGLQLMKKETYAYETES